MNAKNARKLFEKFSRQIANANRFSMDEESGRAGIAPSQHLWLCLIVATVAISGAEPAPIHQWQLDAAHTKSSKVSPTAGTLDATIVGPVAFSADSPPALMLDGDTKAMHRVDLTNDLAKAHLPLKTITAEAWVWIDRAQEWGGIVGAMQDNGAYEKGWLLGYANSQFFFAVSSKERHKLTYLKAQAPFQIGFWYHVVGTYDGGELRIYVDGKLQGASKEQKGEIDYPPHAFYTIGAYHDDDEFYAMAGRIERVAVFDAALNAQQVVDRFKEGQARFPDIVAAPQIVSGWPTYLRDSQRTGQILEDLSLPLKLKWSYVSRYAPKPAWPEEAKNDYYNGKFNMEERVTYDRAFQIVGVDGSIVFGSSADDTVYCLDAETGKERWSFATEGPVRLAPTISGGRVFFGSDDGCAYAVNLSDGALQWKRQLVANPRRIPGNERIISAWPVRTDILVEDDTAYVCAGVFANQGVYEFALKLSDGSVIENKKIDVPAQGYLRRFAGKLQVATGRNPAGAFVSSLKAHGKDPASASASLTKEFPFAFIGAKNVRIGGGDGKIAAFDVEDGKQVWSVEVEGRVHSLAIVNGSLLASTDKGRVYCFTRDVKSETAAITPQPVLKPVYADQTELESTRSRAEWIIGKANIGRGYCLVPSLGVDWRLVYELAKRTEWQIILRESDAKKAEHARTMLNAAGLAGRVSVHFGANEPLPYTDYLFNVVIGNDTAENRRVLRPEGGVLIADTSPDGVFRRGPLEGAGEWTSLYGNTANTACSGDKIVRGENGLPIQWFGRPGPRGMIDRHHRTAAPLYKDGRLFVPGDDHITAVDAYNGTILWEIDAPNTRRTVIFRDSSYLALDERALYVATPDSCVALNPQTGKQQRDFKIPEMNGPKDWGYIASIGEVLLGSAVKPGASRRAMSRQMSLTETHYDTVPQVCSDGLFALDRGDGKTLWTYTPKSGLIINPTIVSDGTAVYFVESGNPETLNNPNGRARLEELVAHGASVTALDLKSGKVIWSRAEPALEALRHNVFAVYAQGLLVIDGSRNNGSDKKASRVVYDVLALDARSGEKRWALSQTQNDEIGGEHGEQERHPAIVGNVLYCEPRAYDLLSGKPVEWKWPWQKQPRRGCGTISASDSCLFFRNDTATLFDIAKGEARKITNETRPGCWINLLPAGGLLLAPEASSGCSCNYAVQTSLALLPVPAPK